MTPWEWVGFLIVLSLAVTALGAVVACCMRSSQKSREIVIGAHCGLCGRWMENALVERDWPWSICEDCANPQQEQDDENLP